MHIQKFIAEVESGAYPAPDVFVFSMGTNDRNLGSAEEALKGKTLDEVDVNTMAGGARWSIQTILEHYPQCRVFVCTPIQTGNPEHNALNLQKIAILRELCRALSVQLIDVTPTVVSPKSLSSLPVAGAICATGCIPTNRGRS